MFETKQKGVALYFSLMIVAISLAIALGLSTILLGQLKTIKEMGNSVVAFYAADAGIEAVLVNRANPVDIPQIDLTNDATYQVFVTKRGVAGCLADNFCIKSIGAYHGTHRAIEITY